VADNDIQDYDDLKGLDLSRLDLDDIELEDEGPSVVLRLLALFLLVGLGAFLLWFPTTDTYLTMGQTNWVFFLLCGVAVVVGIGVGRWVWAWVLDAAARYAARRAREERRVKEPPKPPSALVRWATLLLVLAGGGGILFGLPAYGLLQGEALDSLWFLAAIVAIVVGFLAGRWLLMQAETAIKERPKAAPIRLPGWFKWVTLVVLVGAAVAALVIPAMSNGETDSTIRFSLGMVGLVVGIVGAIWLTRRFDESEAKIRARIARPRARPQG
jgi:MFS family permease